MYSSVRLRFPVPLSFTVTSVASVISKDQNTNFTPSWSSRIGFLVLVIVP
jgi:hypothetical protein